MKPIYNAERVSTESDLYSVQFAIRDTCFNGDIFQRIPLYYLPADIDDRAGLYSDGCIMLDKAYCEAHGTDDSLINAMYHEMIHAHCDYRGIKDTDGSAHTEAFADACEAHGGRYEWENSHYGYGNVALTVKSMKRVKRALQAQKGGK